MKDRAEIARSLSSFTLQHAFQAGLLVADHEHAVLQIKRANHGLGMLGHQPRQVFFRHCIVVHLHVLQIAAAQVEEGFDTALGKLTEGKELLRAQGILEDVAILKLNVVIDEPRSSFAAGGSSGVTIKHYHSFPLPSSFLRQF